MTGRAYECSSWSFYGWRIGLIIGLVSSLAFFVKPHSAMPTQAGLTTSPLPPEQEDELVEGLSDAKRLHLIEQLESARQQDDRNEQQMLNDLAWTDSGASAQTTQFDEQKVLVDDVVKRLVNGESVRWSMIKQALVVPPIP
jgi:hypothetical protein